VAAGDSFVLTGPNTLTVLDNPTEPAALRAELEGLKAQLEMLKSERDNQIELLKNDRDDLRLERDRWQQQATALLEDKRGERAGVVVKVWRSLFRK
jgi:hypothetical protein